MLVIFYKVGAKTTTEKKSCVTLKNSCINIFHLIRLQ